METFMVERYLPGMTTSQFAEAARRVASAGATMTAQGVPVRYLGSFFVPAEECSFCCFEAGDDDAVREANRRAGIPYWRVVRAEMVERFDLRIDADRGHPRTGPRDTTAQKETT